MDINTHELSYIMFGNMFQVFWYSANDTLYDVDMFTKDVCDLCFPETDPQDIDEDDFVEWQKALIMLVREDLLLQHFGCGGLAVIHAELMRCGEQYYVNKVIFKEDKNDIN